MTGSTIIPASERLTLSTSATCAGDRQVAVNDADAAFARQRDRQARLGDRVHRGGDDRDLEHDRPRQPRRSRDVVRQDGRLGRHEQDVVEGEPFLRELRRERDAAAGSSASFSDVHCGEGTGRAADERASAAHASTGSSSLELDAGLQAARVARVEVAGAELERRRSARGDRGAQGLLRVLPAWRPARNAGQQHVAGADSRDRLDLRRDARKRRVSLSPRAAARRNLPRS